MDVPRFRIVEAKGLEYVNVRRGKLETNLYWMVTDSRSLYMLLVIVLAIFA